MQTQRPSSALVAEIEAIRVERDLSNRQFADLLGINNVTWLQVRNANLLPVEGETSLLGTKVLMAFARLDPARFVPLIDTFLLTEPGMETMGANS